MRRATILILLTGCSLAVATAQETESPVPYIPEQESPFFVPREEFIPGTPAAEQRVSQQFPRNKGSDRSAGQMVSEFFTGMFANVRLFGGSGDRNASSRISLEPRNFSLDDRREITVTYEITNRTRDILRLEFPNSQRLEITVADPSGRIVERWSDDRFFPQATGIIMINPDERIEYVERIPTREMQPGVTYTIEASVPNHPDFTRSLKVTPSGAPRVIAPVPEATPTPVERDRNFL